MSSSGLIYAVIVGAWAAYLVPMWLRRQDELNEARPTERFSTAIRLLSGRAAMERRVAKARGESVEPDADITAEDDIDLAGAVDVRSLAVPVTEVRHPLARPAHAPAATPAMGGGNGNGNTKTPVPSPRAKLLARRRRTTTLLFLAFTIGAIAAAVGGVALLWAPAVPAVLLTLYIGQMRRQERRRYEVRLDQRRAAEAARRLRARSEAAAPAPESAPRERERPATEPVVTPPAASSPPAPSPRTADRRALVEQTDHAEWVDQQRAQQSADDGWDPVPVPLPTYVTAPVAPRNPGSLDLGAPDTWSSARSGTTPTEPPAPRREASERGSERHADQQPPARRPRGARTPLFDQYADPDRPRAANE
ncbi:hypothetical protein [Streptomyces sp. HPF1205]|uniref:divisome protein SepX/GlpR n=1 Tax=Streptomyces sp. HPF1205 TaxID=2873262 RepID=UPI001CEC05E4|nr:hypothetical protein [Streptomyces sp. HPF1205]